MAILANTTNSFTLPDLKLSHSFIDTIIPGYSIVSAVFQDLLGINIILFVTVTAVIYALRLSCKFLYDGGKIILTTYCMSQITFDDNDYEVYHPVSTWLSEHKVTEKACGLIASSLTDPIENQNGSMKYNRYHLASGSYWFWHHGRAFLLVRSIYPRDGRYRNDIEISISTFGWSTKPVKKFIESLQQIDRGSKSAMTTINTPALKNLRENSGYLWHRAFERPSRHIDTIAMDKAQKQATLGDIREYLDPETASWYSDRGIPRRRGYLLWVPPGQSILSTASSFAHGSCILFSRHVC